MRAVKEAKTKIITLGVLDLIPVYPGTTASAALGQAVKLAQTAENNGYARYWVAEHHDMEMLACSSPEVVLAHIGAQTERIRLGSGAVLLPHYKAIKVAETFNLLATLYPGRIDLGLGRAPGGSAHLSIALSGNFLENVRQLPDTLRDLMLLLEGRYQLEGQSVTARPVPEIPPDVWMLGTNQKSAAYAAEFGTGYVFGQFMSDADGTEVLAAYRQAFQPSRLCPHARTIVAVGVICAETEEAALQLAAESASLFRPKAVTSGAASEPLATGAADTAKPTSNPKLLVGKPQQVKARLHELQQLYEADEFLVVCHIADYAKRLRSYELLAEAMLTDP